MRCIFLILSLFSVSLYADINADVFVLSADIDHMTLSPDGKKIAYTRGKEGEKVLVIQYVGGDLITAFEVGEDKMRGFRFVGNDYLVMRKSITTDFQGYKGTYEFWAAIAVNINTNKARQFLIKTDSLLWPQTVMDRIVAVSKDQKHVLMAARSGNKQADWSYDLYKVNLDSGRGKIIKRGTQQGTDWFVDNEGIVYAREDFINEQDKHVVKKLVDNKSEYLFVNESEIAVVSSIGLSDDKQSLISIDSDPSGNFEATYHFSLKDGKQSEPVFYSEGKEIDRIIRGWDEQIIGVQFSGFNPSYEFYDQTLTTKIAQIVERAAPASIYIAGVSSDLQNVLMLMEGNGQSGRYLLFNTVTGKLQNIARKRPHVPDENVAYTQTDYIKARDELTIPTLLTLPRNHNKEQALAAIVLPHGGPEAYDQMGYNYMAQYFAHLGYAVIQPNFRGSTGFGWDHKQQGRGKWGKEMQTDISDALRYYVAKGVVDAKRVCIVGASYGGYAALAGGAFTPELYRCVAAIAPVSDLPLMLRTEEKQYGKDHWVVAYWNRVIGDRKEAEESLIEVSPAYHADNFTSPVLLIHGKDDTVVPMRQSTVMNSKLKKAGKKVKFVKLKGEDHWLSTQETRLRTLQEVSKFVGKHLN